MPYWRLFYHLVWATRERERWITADLEQQLYPLLRKKAEDLGATVYALNGVEDHVHLVAAIPPKIAVATFVGQVKAVASSRINKAGILDHPFLWQDEYGVFSFDHKRLDRIVNYVERQKEHHAENTLIVALEKTVGSSF